MNTAHRSRIPTKPWYDLAWFFHQKGGKRSYLG
jgi:hypothetical protein